MLSLPGGKPVNAVLEVKKLKKYFSTTKGVVKAVNDVSFSITPGETLGLVGDCLLYTSDAADDLLCVDLGGRRIIKKKKQKNKNKQHIIHIIKHIHIQHHNSIQACIIV